MRLAVADLDDLAEVHHRDLGAEVPHDREVVGDEQERDVELPLQVLEQVDDLRLDRHVERGDRLVGDQQLGVQGQRAGDADALALAAGELVGVAVVVLRVEPDDLEQLLDPAAGSASSGTILWIASGAPTIEPTVCRGFSEVYGSWKIIWISRRSGLSCRGDSLRDVLALEPDRAAGRLVAAG